MIPSVAIGGYKKMAKFENGITGYIEGTYTAKIYFPIDKRGTAHINCMQCYYFNSNTNRCRLNGEVCQFPAQYVGGSCPLDFTDN